MVSFRSVYFFFSFVEILYTFKSAKLPSSSMRKHVSSRPTTHTFLPSLPLPNATLNRLRILPLLRSARPLSTTTSGMAGPALLLLRIAKRRLSRKTRPTTPLPLIRTSASSVGGAWRSARRFRGSARLVLWAEARTSRCQLCRACLWTGPSVLSADR